MQYFVYILLCADTTYYTGSTNDLQKRLLLHNSKKSGAKYTRMRQPVELAYSESFTTYSEARSREAAIKRLTHKLKEALVNAK